MNTSLAKDHEFQSKLAVYKNRILQLGQNNAEYLRANKQHASQYIHELISLSIETATITSMNIFSSEDDTSNLAVYLLKIISQNNMLNGGLITLKELQYHFSNYSLMISKEQLTDIVNNHLHSWNTGISLFYLENRQQPIVRCFPMEISKDHERVLSLLKKKEELNREACLSAKELEETEGWSEVRCLSVLRSMAQAGILWIDSGNSESHETTYWDYSSIYS